MGGGKYSCPRWAGYKTKTVCIQCKLGMESCMQLVDNGIPVSVGYNDDGDLLWFGEVSGPILDGGGVHFRDITPVEV